MNQKQILAERERLQEQIAFASDPDCGSTALLAIAQLNLARFERSLRKQKPVKKDEPKQVICPDCNSPMVPRNGKYGEFYGCSDFPNCRKCLSIHKAKKQLEKHQSKSKAFELGCPHTPTHVEGDNCVGCGGNTSGQATTFKPSRFQQAVFDFISNCEGNAVVEAVAGSGKTTTIVQALKLTPENASVLFCAFNKHIQRELASKAPSHVQVSTVHSIGFSALKENLKSKPEVDSNKLWGIIKEVLPHPMEHHLRSPLAKLVGMCKRTLTDPSDAIAVIDIAEHYGIVLNGDAERIVSLVPVVMQICRDRVATIDFDDMIWLPIVLGFKPRTFSWVFVDECQDLSPAQLALVKMSVAGHNGRIIAVGDRNQSIYGFTGADIQAVPRLIKELDATVLPLSITYRCPKSIVKLAQGIVPHIEAADNAIEGEIKDIPYSKMISDVKDRDLILCRVNAPLVKACYGFIRSGRKAVIRGRDIGKNLISFIDRLEANDVVQLLAHMNEYKHNEIVKLEASGKEHMIESLVDRCDTLEALCDGIGSIRELKSRITSIFNDITKDGIILSSIHRAKGDESTAVWLLRRELLPHPLATSGWQQKQERNLEYVAYTRTKESLFFVTGA